jgi:hypothetical protein
VIGVVQAKEQLQELLQESAQEVAPFGARAEPLRAIACYVGKQALHEHGNPIIQEMHP